MAVALSDEEGAVLGAELDALLPAFDGARLDRYLALAEAVHAGEVDDELVPELESVLELSLSTARARRLYSAEGERLLTEVLRRTPRGRDLQDQLDQVNAALSAVAGATLRSVSVRMRTLGNFTVTVTSDAASLTLAVRPDGVAVEAVSVGEPAGAAG
jgi:hypothetical protein